MPLLVLPDAAFARTYVAAMAEFVAEGRGGEETRVGQDRAEWGSSWHTAAGFGAFAAAVRAEADPATPRPPGRVPESTLWWVETGPEAPEPTYLGGIRIRHHLTAYLREVGGHIGYDVRPSRRREGHATRMLRAALPHAYALGITSALITCDTDNVASRRVIEANGGVLEDQRGEKLRFRVPTGPVA